MVRDEKWPPGASAGHPDGRPAKPMGFADPGCRRGVLILDPDRDAQLQLARHVLEADLVPQMARDVPEALACLRSQDEIFAVIADLATPGLEEAEFVDEFSRRQLEVSLLLMSEDAKPQLALALMREGAFDTLAKPFRASEVRARLDCIRAQQALRAESLDLMLREETQRIEREQLIEVMIGLAKLVDAKSPYTQEHSDRVALTVKLFSRFLGVSQQEVEDYSFGAKLHDIGKVGVPDRILESTGRLSKEERGIIMGHPLAGAKILEPITMMHDIIPMVLHHHENWDGSGYPDGLVGENCPLGARITKIADYFDAITGHRPYREPLSFEDAAKVLESESGRVLDPELTRAFVEMIRSGVLLRGCDSGVLPAVQPSARQLARS